MIVLAMIAFGWVALMTLVVSSCRAASLGDRSQQAPPSAPLPRPVSQPVRRRRAVARSGRRATELQRPV